jgi:TM2 domain-containing membrane protein YozV
MAQLINLLPEIDGEEMVFVQGLIKDWDDQRAQQFANIYRARRKDPQIILLTTILGFLVIAGIQRFILGEIGMGILYLLTGGLCFIGTIIDLVNYKKMTFDYNAKTAQQVAIMVKGLN